MSTPFKRVVAVNLISVVAEVSFRKRFPDVYVEGLLIVGRIDILGRWKKMACFAAVGFICVVTILQNRRAYSSGGRGRGPNSKSLC
jgi:hypothetical protein